MSDKMSSTQILHTKLKKYRGAIGEVAKKSGRTREWVRLVLLERHYDLKVLHVAAKVLEERYNNEKRALEIVREAAHSYDSDQLRAAEAW